MTTQEHTDTNNLQRYEILWSGDGRHVSRLSYTEEQLEDIQEIVETVVREMGAQKGLDLIVH